LDPRRRKWREEGELHNEELHNLYASPNLNRVVKSRRMRWAGHIDRMGTMINAYKSLVGKLEGKRPFGRARRRWRIILEWILRK
jgi:hypothetical protein